MAHVRRWEPFGAELDRWFGGGGPPSFLRFGADLATDVYEEDDTVVVEMHAPDIDPSEIDVSIEGDYLRVSGSREESDEEEKRDYYRKEIRRGSFERIIPLPQAVDRDKASAEYENGCLVVMLPKAVGVEAGKVKVEVKG